MGTEQNNHIAKDTHFITEPEVTKTEFENFISSELISSYTETESEANLLSATITTVGTSTITKTEKMPATTTDETTKETTSTEKTSITISSFNVTAPLTEATNFSTTLPLATSAYGDTSM